MDGMDGMVLGVYMDEVWAGYEVWGGKGGWGGGWGGGGGVWGGGGGGGGGGAGGGIMGKESKRVRGVQGSNISPFSSLLLRRRASARGCRWWRLCRNRTRCGGLARG